MPCNCDGYEPSKSTLQAIQISMLLRYVLPLVDVDTPEWIEKIAHRRASPYAHHVSQDFCDKLTRLLCHTCKTMSPAQQSTFIYDGRNATARRLADWWDAHQAADQARLPREVAEIKQKKTAETARSKLTAEKLAALGIKP